MNIQRATLNELDSLTEVFDLYRLFYEQESDLEGARDFLKDRLVNEESVVFLAFVENNPVGFVQ
ncbi:MAG: GNAT family N-acetyltransferase, partial [Paenisporosarcina sp.]